MSTATASYKGHRYPVEIINHCVWLYFRFPLSFREVEELMLVRGVVVSYETIRRWCAKFGQAYANQLGIVGARDDQCRLPDKRQQRDARPACIEPGCRGRTCAPLPHRRGSGHTSCAATTPPPSHSRNSPEDEG